MPVHREGKNIVENATGKTVGHSTSTKKAEAATRIRNMAHAAKLGDPKAKKGMKKLKAWEEENPYNRQRM